jgi:hypothetical protein
MKTILQTLLIVCLTLLDGIGYAQSIGPFLLTGPAATGGGGGTKNFIVEQVTAGTITPVSTSSTFIVVVTGITGTPSLSSSVGNTYAQATNSSAHVGVQSSVFIFVSVGTLSASAETISQSGLLDGIIKVVEINGVTGVDVAGASTGTSPATISLTTSSADIFVEAICNENAVVGTSGTLDPGSISSSSLFVDGAQFSAAWGFTNVVGYVSGTWTLSASSGSVGAAYAAIALR